MKRLRRLRFMIAGVMIASMAVLFLIFIGVFRYSFNRYYTKLATRAVESEIKFVKTFDMEDEEASEEYFDKDDIILSEYIRYLLTDDRYRKIDQEGAEFYGITAKEADRILGYVREYKKDLKAGRVIEISERGDNYVMGLIDYRKLKNWEEDGFNIAIVYVDIDPILAISRNFSAAALAALAFVSILMCMIGIWIGKRVEEERARQTTFFQNASHELKTPLMSIQGYAEGIQTGVIDPQDAASVIMDESQRMTDLVQEILDISKIESSRMQLTIEEVDLKELLYDTLRSVEPVARKQGIWLDVDFPDERIEIRCDEVQLRKAVLNLLSNALRHAENVISASCAGEGKNILITVTNDGPPIDKEMQKRVFERFYTGPNGSTGIGLALTRDIVELHGGKVIAEARDGRTVFEISLPA